MTPEEKQQLENYCHAISTSLAGILAMTDPDMATLQQELLKQQQGQAADAEPAISGSIPGIPDELLPNTGDATIDKFMGQALQQLEQTNADINRMNQAMVQQTMARMQQQQPIDLNQLAEQGNFKDKGEGNGTRPTG